MYVEPVKPAVDPVDSYSPSHHTQSSPEIGTAAKHNKSDSPLMPPIVRGKQALDGPREIQSERGGTAVKYWTNCVHTFLPPPPDMHFRTGHAG